MNNDVLSNALSKINNAEKIGSRQIILRPSARLTKQVLTILNDLKYIGSFEEKEDGRGNYLILNLIGCVNKCNSIKPRFAVTVKEYEKFEKRFLPSKGFGVLLVSTPKGLMTNEQAKEKNMGGKLIAYCY